MDIADAMEKLGCRGFTMWQDIAGRGTQTGEPHLGNHAWPTMNNAILTFVEDEKVDEVIDIISTNSKKRKQPMPLNTNYGVGVMPVEVTVGGATIFVTDVERFEKV